MRRSAPRELKAPTETCGHAIRAAERADCAGASPARGPGVYPFSEYNQVSCLVALSADDAGADVYWTGLQRKPARADRKHAAGLWTGADVVLPSAYSADPPAGDPGDALACTGRNRLAVWQPSNGSASAATGVCLEPLVTLCRVVAGGINSVLPLPLVCRSEVKKEEQVAQLSVITETTDTRQPLME